MTSTCKLELTTMVQNSVTTCSATSATCWIPLLDYLETMEYKMSPICHLHPSIVFLLLNISLSQLPMKTSSLGTCWPPLSRTWSWSLSWSLCGWDERSTPCTCVPSHCSLATGEYRGCWDCCKEEAIRFHSFCNFVGLVSFQVWQWAMPTVV